MICPNCEYEPEINEFDYCETPGRFYELGIEARRENNEEWYAKHKSQDREQIYGCPRCGIMFMNV